MALFLAALNFENARIGCEVVSVGYAERIEAGKEARNFPAA
jgi:hypothetical protein